MSHASGISVGCHGSPSSSMWSGVESVNKRKDSAVRKKSSGHSQFGTDSSDWWIGKKAHKDGFEIWKLEDHQIARNKPNNSLSVACICCNESDVGF